VWEIYISGAYPWTVKFLYCKRCKDIRLKSWYAISNRCPICLSNATPIKVPNIWLTYLMYLLYVLSPSILVIYVIEDDRTYLYVALFMVLVMMVISWLELGRGREYARAKVKITQQNLGDFRKRGWT
jgi:hypothetical protein